MAPWSKEAGPLGKAQKEGDVLKKKVDVAVKESLKVVNNKKLADRETKLEHMYTNCIETKLLVQKHCDTLEQLKEEEEPTKMKDYEKKKTAELTRMNAMTTQLTEAMKKLFPDRVEAEHLKHLHSQESAIKEKAENATKTAESPKDEEEEDDEDEDDEEETEEEDDEDKEESTTEEKTQSQVQVKKNEEEDDDDDEEEDDDDDEEDDEEEDEEKQKKDVKVEQEKTKSDDETDEEEEGSGEDEEEDEEEEDEEDSESATNNQKKTKSQVKKKKENELEVTHSAHRFVAIQEYEGEEDGDLAFEKGDVLTIVETREDGWWIAENAKGDKGLVPSTFLKIHNPYKSVQLDEEEDDEDENEKTNESGQTPRKSGKALWGGIKSAVNETTVSDVLHAMGAVPSGFRISTLCRKFNEGNTYRMVNYLAPKLSKSNLAYRDLSFDPVTNRIRSRPARIDRLVTLVSCQQIPPPGAGIEVLDRHVRVCLFDGQHILSNIHSVKVTFVDKSTRIWSFTTRVHDLMDPHMHGEIFVRTNNTSDNIGILFELCVSYKRTSTQERGEFSCGWVHLPLLENGTVITNKSFDLYVHGGTFYEKGVEVDPSISRRAANNALVSLISGNKQPRLLLKVHMPRPVHKDLMDTLPETLVGNTCLLRLYSYYRQWQADKLLRDRIDLDSTEPIHDPLLKQFPHAADTPDLMEFFTHEWIRTLREVKKDEKLLAPKPLKDEEFMKELFMKVFMESVYPVSHLAMLPDYIMGDTENAQLRRENVKKFAELKKVGKSSLAALLSSDLMYAPFELDEVVFNNIGPYCLDN